jgi:hypothetical protein
MKLLSKLALRAEDSLLVGIIIFYLKSYNFNAFALPITCFFFQFSYIKRTFAQNLEAHFHAKNKKHSDHRSR